MPDWLAILKAYVDDLETAIGAIEGGTTLHDKLTAVRAALLDEITAARMEELDGANLPADIDTLLTRLSAVRAGYLDQLDFDLQETLTTIAEYLDTEIDAVITSQGRMLFTLDFWSDPQEEVQVPTAAATLVITPTVTVADLPAGAVIVRAIAMFKFRMVENIYAGVNKLDGATVGSTSQVIQVKETAGGAYTDAINFVDDQFTLADAAREGGDVLIGSIDIAGEVDGNDGYTFQWLLRKADQDFINFNDVQVGLRIWYSV